MGNFTSVAFLTPVAVTIKEPVVCVVVALCAGPPVHVGMEGRGVLIGVGVAIGGGVAAGRELGAQPGGRVGGVGEGSCAPRRYVGRR